MSIDDMKSAAFRHCDKIVLAVVAVFVAMQVYSHFSPAEERGGGGIGGGAQAAKAAEDDQDHVLVVAAPFIDVQTPITADHDPFWPPSVHGLREVRLHMGAPAEPEAEKPGKAEETEKGKRAAAASEGPEAEPEKLPADVRQKLSKAIRDLPVRLVGTKLNPWVPDDALLRDIDPNRERLMAVTPEMRTPCVVRATVDRATRKRITFEAVKAGDWIGFEGNLEDKNKVQVAIMVFPKVITAAIELLGVADVAVAEEALGQVVVRFVPQQQPRDVRSRKDEATKRAATLYVEPAAYRIYRRSEHDKEKKQVGELAGRTSGGRPATPARPGYDPRRITPEGLPMGEEGLPPDYMPEGGDPRLRGRGVRMPGLPPGLPGVASPEGMMAAGEAGGLPPRGVPVQPPAGRRTTGAIKARTGEMAFVDDTVESETTYTYWVEAVGPDAPGFGQAAPKLSKGVEITTKQKFSFAYVGNTSKGAKIVVFIGSKDDPLSHRTFIVPRGGRIGQLPGQAEAEARAEEERNERADRSRRAARAGSEDDGHDYVTRFVLVDFMPQAACLLTRDATVADSGGKMVRIKTYQFMRKHMAIIRDRKNRLMRLWREAAPKLAEPGRQGVPTRRPGERPRVPGPALEGMQEGMKMEELGPGRRRPGSTRPSRPRRPRNK